MTRRILWAAVIVLTILVGLFPARQAEADINGSFPPPATKGLVLLVYTSGGSMDDLRQEISQRGCGVLSVWANNPFGDFIGYFYGTPKFVVEDFLEAFPEGQVPPGTPLLAVCQEGEVMGPVQYECGGAVFVIEEWNNIPPQLTEKTNAYFVPQPEARVRYLFPQNARGARLVVGLETSVGRIPAGTFPGFELNGVPYTLYTYLMGASFPSSAFIGGKGTDGDGEWHSETVYFSLETESDYDKGQPHRTLPPGQRYSEYSKPPFKVLTLPVILSTFAVEGEVWDLDTYRTPSCLRLAPA